jgi:hypothetical protein
VALAALESGAAQRHALVERHPVADLGRLPDHHSGPMVDEEVGADLGPRMDLDPGDPAAEVGDRHRSHGHAGLIERVGQPMREQRLHTGPAGEDLHGRDAAGGGVAITCRRHVVAHLPYHPPECRQAEHD